MQRGLSSLVALSLTLALVPFRMAEGQATSNSRARVTRMDSARIAELYVSNRPEDHPQRDHARDVMIKARTDTIYRMRSRGVMDFHKISYRSGADGMVIPAYLFAPLSKRGVRGHAAMVWVHGGVHGDWGASMFPFVREAVERGYVVIAPDYRGSTGYGSAHYNAIDYGGKELDDVASAVEYLKTLPYVDQERLGIMGWSHGGFIAAHLAFRGERQPFKGAAAIVPVTNLIFRLAFRGPGYARGFATQAGIGGLPHERQEEYVRRSPLYRVDSLRIPILVHVATNDDDVFFVEDELMISALRAKKPDLAETKVYVDPPSGHSFSRRVDPTTLERLDTPEQRDSWNRTWAFFEWILRPYEDRSRPASP
jgi:dipeptidyl aminopeptidase/acylaminoacyl peptidase